MISEVRTSTLIERKSASAPCQLQELLRRNRHVIALRESSAKLIGYIHGDIAGPALGGIEGDDTSRTDVLIVQQVAHQRLAVSIGFGRLSPDAAVGPGFAGEVTEAAAITSALTG